MFRYQFKGEAEAAAVQEMAGMILALSRTWRAKKSVEMVVTGEAAAIRAVIRAAIRAAAVAGAAAAEVEAPPLATTGAATRIAAMIAVAAAGTRGVSDYVRVVSDGLLFDLFACLPE